MVGAHGQNLGTETSALMGAHGQNLDTERTALVGGTQSKLGHREVCTESGVR